MIYVGDFTDLQSENVRVPTCMMSIQCTIEKRPRPGREWTTETELHQSYATRCELHPWNQKICVSWDMILERRVGRSSREIERMRGLRFEWAGCRGDVCFFVVALLVLRCQPVAVYNTQTVSKSKHS